MSNSFSAPAPACRVLVVDDEKWIRHALWVYLSRDGSVVETARSAVAALTLASRRNYDVLLVDLEMPGTDGLSLLGELTRSCGQALCIALAASPEEPRPAEALKLGAASCLLKPLDGEALAEIARWIAVRNGLTRAPLGHRVTDPEREVVAESPTSQAAFLQVSRAAPLSGPILLEGESGCGRGFLARLAHLWGPGSSGRLVRLDCPRASESLLESALESARGGGLYLEEIGKLPRVLQGRLAAALADRDGRGGRHTRLIASTSQDLRRETRLGRFHGELYRRLDETRIRVPRLRDRPQDILPLACRFLRQSDLRSGKPAHGISADAVRFLQTQRWRGNLHELIDAVACAAACAEGVDVTARDLRAYRARSNLLWRPYLANARNGLSRVIRRMVGSGTPEEAKAGRKACTRYA
ncbi:MAG TPA: response regulator [Spirochaetia bacterium]|nr:response regulator [Spirochaetia bacterium]